MECLRILHHLLKDKGMASTYDDPEMSLALNNNKWLKSACLEAIEALDNPDLGEQGPAYTAKGASN